MLKSCISIGFVSFLPFARAAEIYAILAMPFFVLFLRAMIEHLAAARRRRPVRPSASQSLNNVE